MIWVGLDLHKKYITACALDEAGGLVAEHRRLPADAGSLLSWLSGLGGAVTVAMGATLYWTWLQDPLSTAGIAIVAAHPYQVKLIWHARAKTDPIDARRLADSPRMPGSCRAPRAREGRRPMGALGARVVPGSNGS